MSPVAEQVEAEEEGAIELNEAIYKLESTALFVCLLVYLFIAVWK